MTLNLAFETTLQDAGKRLDVVLAQRLARSRTACAELIRDGHVLVNGRAAKAAQIVEAESTIAVDMPAPRDPGAIAQDIPISVIHDEADFCVVDKAAGMATHPARGNLDGTMVNALLAKLGPLPAINGVRRPGIVHRLDKDTSGLLVVAKTERAMVALSEAMAQRRIKRFYDAVIWGIPPNRRGIVEAPIGRDPNERTRFAVREDGRRAVTHYKVTQVFASVSAAADPPDAALLRLELETGRTHQIRVHCAAIGHPIIGDLTYGPGRPGLGIRRQALHAAELMFAHPISGEKLRFVAPWPADFTALVKRLRSGAAT